MIKNIFHKKEKYMLVIYCIVILLITNIYLEKAVLPNIINDEYGYWLSAAFFAGKDWSSVAQGINYYGYGYGLILSLIMRTVNDVFLIYKISLFLNSVWLCLSFLCLVQISKILYKNILNLQNYFICFIVTLCSSNICLKNYTLPEVFLFFLHCLITLTFFLIIKTGSKKGFILLALEVTYAYTVHQRTIILFLIIFLLSIYMLKIKKINGRQILIFVISTVVFFIFWNAIKTYVLSEVWLNNEIVNGNDYLGQKDKIFALFSLEGIFSFIQNMCGRVIYFILSTFCIGVVVVKNTIVNCIASIRNKEEIEIYSLFAVFCILAGMIVSSIFLLYPDHSTHIFYGRYFENYYGPLLLIGLCDIYENKSSRINKRNLLIFWMTLVLLIFFIKEGCEIRNIPIANYSVNSVSMSGFYKFNKDDFYYGIIIFWGNIILLFLLCTNNWQSKVQKYIFLIMLFLLQLQCGKDAYLTFQSKYCDNLVNSTIGIYDTIVDINSALEEKYDIYAVDDNSGVFCAGAPIQYVFMEEKVHYFENVEKITELDEESILISSGNINNIPGMHQVKKINLFTIWISNNNDILNEYFE